MRQRYQIVIFLGMLLVAGFSASCQKPFHEETERYILVAANINLEYWQEAGAGFSDAARGLGLGSRLVDECMAFARQAGYRTMVLWTQDILHAAQHIYRKSGFQLVREAPHSEFGIPMTGQIWELRLL